MAHQNLNMLYVMTEGITSDHVIASASFPVNFDYVNLNVEKHDISQGNHLISNENKY